MYLRLRREKYIYYYAVVPSVLKEMDKEVEDKKAGETKRCSKCGEIKEYNEFHKHKGNLDGHTFHCKECRKQYRIDNKEHIKQCDKQYRSSEAGRLLKAKVKAKRRRNLSFIPIIQSNPFPCKTDWHHVNNLFVLPLPKRLHQKSVGHNHRSNCETIIDNIFGLDINALLTGGY